MSSIISPQYFLVTGIDRIGVTFDATQLRRNSIRHFNKNFIRLFLGIFCSFKYIFKHFIVAEQKGIPRTNLFQNYVRSVGGFGQERRHKQCHRPYVYHPSNDNDYYNCVKFTEKTQFLLHTLLHLFHIYIAHILE